MRRPLLALAAVLSVLPAAAGAKGIQIQAHRGGSVTNGKPTFPENTLPGFTRAAKNGFAVEWDTHVTKDGVPVVIHDGTYDRTTRCTGPDDALTFAYIEAHCKSDVLGAPMSSFTFRRVKPSIPIPRLSTALAAMRKLGATVSLEINNYPTYPDFDSTYTTFPNHVIDTIIKSRFPLKHLIIQSFLPNNLMVAKRRLPTARRSLITFSHDYTPDLVAFAKQVKATYLSPQWPITGAYVRAAHAAGYKVVPYTLDTKAQVLAAKRAGVDALITDDPFRARKALG